MGATPGELARRATSSEISDLMASMIADPPAAERGEAMLAQLTALTANLNRGKKTRPFAPSDFFLFLKRPDPSAGGRAAGASLISAIRGMRQRQKKG